MYFINFIQVLMFKIYFFKLYTGFLSFNLYLFTKIYMFCIWKATFSILKLVKPN